MIMVSKDHKTWEEILKEGVKAIQENKELWCPQCSKFTPFKDLTFHGKTEKGESIASLHYEDIFEFEGFLYSCSECGYIAEGLQIGNIEV